MLNKESLMMNQELTREEKILYYENLIKENPSDFGASTPEQVHETATGLADSFEITYKGNNKFEVRRSETYWLTRL